MADQPARKSRKGPSKLERLEARITRDQKRIIERAARLRGTSVTDFVVVSAQQAARDTINDFEMMRLRGEGREAFVQALLNPPTPNAAASRAAERFQRRLGR